MTSRLYLTRGVPGSGKSTYARKWVDENPKQRVRINRDDLRWMLFGAYWGVDEKAVTRVQDVLLRAAIADGKDIILDNTNLQSKNVIDTLKIAAETRGVFVEFVDFPISFEDAVARDAARDRTVGEDVIRSFYDRFLGGVKNPRFPEAPRLPAEWVFQEVVQDETLPKAIVVDIDGTLANHTGVRDPYDATRYHLDGYHSIVGIAVRSLADTIGARVVVMSGRDAAYKEPTVAWLEANGFEYDEIHMRPVGDIRNDAVVKHQIVVENLLPRFNIVVCFDDRNRVVKMLRKIGLRVWQVQDGDF